MEKYFYLQLKRVLRILPFVLCVVAILFGSLMLAYDAMIRMNEDNEDKAKFKVGIVGTAGDTYLELGLAALETFDSTRFAVEIDDMTEPEAVKAMERGDIAAFVVIPGGFVDAAMYGKLMPLKYVSTSGAVGLVSMFKDEITLVISDILLEAQKGIYGAGEAMVVQGHSAGQVVNDLSIEYVEFVFDRSKVYSVSELGISDGLGLEGYMLCGLSVLFLLLTCLPFAPLFVRRDLSLSRMLAARRRPVFGQVVCEFGAYLLGMLALLTVLLLCVGIFSVEGEASLGVMSVVNALPVILVVTALSFVLYELTGDLISGVLLQFFTALVLAFVSGCLYPIYFFPEPVQKLARVLPMGIARSQLAACITGEFSVTSTLALLGYSCVFFVAALLIRKHKITSARG